jgi:hypothetical protein
LDRNRLGKILRRLSFAGALKYREMTLSTFDIKIEKIGFISPAGPSGAPPKFKWIAPIRVR